VGIWIVLGVVCLISVVLCIYGCIVDKEKGFYISLSSVVISVFTLFTVLAYNACLKNQQALVEQYNTLKVYECYDWTDSLSDIAIRNSVYESFNAYNTRLSSVKAEVKTRAFWTFYQKEVVDSLNYLTFKEICD
jgi:hypothetical protein